jgi:hypothetical protein
MKMSMGCISPLLYAPLIFMFLALAGCGGGRNMPATAKVSGVVTIGGKPVEGVEVRFESNDFASYGKTDAQGRYRLVQGATVGQNKVYLSKMSGPAGVTPPEGIDETQLQIMAEASGGAVSANVPRQTIPAEYSDKQKSKLTFTVPAGGTDSANFDL